MRILLAEDDGRIGQSLQGAFEVHGDAIDWVKDGKQAHHAIATNNYEVLLLDVNMPYEDGLSLISVARRQAYAKDLSIIIITANDNVKERVQALDLGADDYLVKPFDLSELLARIRAVKRRQLGYQCNQLSNDVLTLDLDSRQVQYQGEWKYLSNREYAVLYALMSHAGAVQSRQALEEKIYSWHSEIESNVIEFIIHSLRKKLGSDVIKNIRGLGWFVDKKS
nr:response regulator [Moraxella sp.]